WELSFTGDLSEFRRIYLRIQVLVGKVMAPYGAAGEGFGDETGRINHGRDRGFRSIVLKLN
uniref:hypothetical protein n=1 Tax=Leptospira weilii TaxID=28184 RepID=UPI00055F9CAB